MTHRFDWTTHYPSTRVPVFARNVVSTSHPLGAQAGLRMIQQGGNAVDAAIAAAAVMMLVEPCSNGLGSDAFCILWDGERLHGLNASGPAPAAWTPAYFRGKHGADAKRPPVRGWDSVTVPGAVAGWLALSERFGKLPFGDVLEPAIDIAERGYAVPVVVQQKWAAATPLLKDQPGWAEAFLPRGRAPEVSEHFAFPAAARSLRAIQSSRGTALYGGEIAEAAAAHARANGGAITVADFASYRPEWVEPIGLDVYGHRLHEIPPNGQGIAALVALGILRHFDIASLPVDGADATHLQIEAMKLAFADVYEHVADARSMRLTPAEMLDDGYLRERSRLIDPRRAQQFAAGKPPSGGTIYLSAADERGMMVSFIQSNYMGFGSGVVVPGWGLSMQNRGHGFVLDDTSPNCVAPGRRPFHTIIPAFLTRDGRPQMSFGIMGGNMQPQAHLQAIVRMLVHRQQPQAACDAPRWRFDHGFSIDVEQAMDPRTAAALVERGHRVAVLQDSYQDFGAGQFIWRLGDPAVEGYVAASDSRRDGLAAGF
ncbi:MAG TPA: gamma-glutamyltransferase family protein [Caldimonas sp.]|jgi:gamma-glutamyltranspeptidase/glutathione hydrolase|nr:gamma-glutamyltransferase family protein [Caldimonas sp.]HEX2541938.1 gamma-glutamyltransferase family protein [Caldimonas sp.]